LREEDLVPAFLSVLAELAPTVAAHLEASYQDEITHLEQGLWPDADRLGFLMEELFDALDDAAPQGYHFSAHEGDGSDFGFWQNDEEDA
jgi:hypothetical protein